MNSQRFKEQILPLYSQMLAVAARMLDGDMPAAADAVQDTVVSLWERRRDIEISHSPQALCIAAVRNRCITLIRSHHRSVYSDTEIAEMPDSAGADSNTDLERVRMAVNLLPEPQRTVVRMSMRGFSCAEIAETGRDSEGNVRQILSRGRRRLREILSQL